jgi:hypothetical protein
VDDGDYGVWRANFGKSVQAGTSGDGNNDGVVDTSDYIVWRKNLGVSMGNGNNAAQSSLAGSAAVLSTTDNLADGDESFESAKQFPLADSLINEMNTPDSNSLVRAVIQPAISHSVRDLLLTSEDWAVGSLSRKATVMVHETDRDDLESANDTDIAERAWDEVFRTLAEVSIVG